MAFHTRAMKASEARERTWRRGSGAENTIRHGRGARAAPSTEGRASPPRVDVFLDVKTRSQEMDGDSVPRETRTAQLICPSRVIGGAARVGCQPKPGSTLLRAGHPRPQSPTGLKGRGRRTLLRARAP